MYIYIDIYEKIYVNADEMLRLMHSKSSTSHFWVIYDKLKMTQTLDWWQTQNELFMTNDLKFMRNSTWAIYDKVKKSCMHASTRTITNSIISENDYTKSCVCIHSDVGMYDSCVFALTANIHDSCIFAVNKGLVYIRSEWGLVYIRTHCEYTRVVHAYVTADPTHLTNSVVSVPMYSFWGTETTEMSYTSNVLLLNITH